ncbi:hypothetical protein TNCV_756591 [Trichonephila clavipes]|nr:hypothetical protein TNCV_756591 [Trichonephila clavipes]
MIQKIDSGHVVGLYGVRNSLECLFGLGTLSKIKILSSVLHRQTSGAFLWGGNWASKVRTVVDIAYIVPHQNVIPAPGECTRSEKAEIQHGRHQEKERENILLLSSLAGCKIFGRTLMDTLKHRRNYFSASPSSRYQSDLEKRPQIMRCTVNKIKQLWEIRFCDFVCGKSQYMAIPVERIQKLVEPMSRLVAAVIKARGGPTCYLVTIIDRYP